MDSSKVYCFRFGAKGGYAAPKEAGGSTEEVVRNGTGIRKLMTRIFRDKPHNVRQELTRKRAASSRRWRPEVFHAEFSLPYGMASPRGERRYATAISRAASEPNVHGQLLRCYPRSWIARCISVMVPVSATRLRLRPPATRRLDPDHMLGIFRARGPVVTGAVSNRRRSSPVSANAANQRLSHTYIMMWLRAPFLLAFAQPVPTARRRP